MGDAPPGKVVTFYSYKGGTGRTMALANVAWILAANGKRVLAVDWDLESPGLHRYFFPFLDEAALQTQVGVIQLIQQFQWNQASNRAAAGPTTDHTDVSAHALKLDWNRFPADGRLDFLSAGRQNNDYAAALAGLDWDDFFERQGGNDFVEALRARMKQEYDYVLIDSRTGFSDVADICTLHLPDVVVDCFTLNEQGIDGAVRVARSIQDNDRDIVILPVPMRVDPAEQIKADTGRAAAQQRFAGLPAAPSEEERELYWKRMYVPYRAYYGYEEILATFGDAAGEPGRLLSAYELLTAEITGGTVTALPRMDDSTRWHVVSQFQRQLAVAEREIILRYAPEDLVWAEWLSHLLVAANISVVDATQGEQPKLARSRELIVVSKAYAATDGHVPTPSPEARTPLAVYVDDVPFVPGVQPADSAFIAGVAESTAIDRVLRLVGHAAANVNATGNRPRFPALGPGQHNLDARNTWFTGREEDLRSLRRQFRSSGGRVVLAGARPVALQGMGGIGKTQVALEYAHRFAAAYDVIWWIKAEPVAFVDTQLDELGRKIGVHIAGPAPESAIAVLHALARGEPHRRWLIIFDNAEEPEKLDRWLPTGPGHVLITSRNPAWTDRARSVQVDVFKRKESIEHLRNRVEDLAIADADALSDLLGDLPIAVAAAAAWLNETGVAVADYMRRIDTVGPTAITLASDSPGYPPTADGTTQTVQAVWEMSLSRLQERSPAAYRLLQLCSVMDPRIAIELIYGDELGEMLGPFDPEVTEREVRGMLIKEISRLALLRVEPRGDRQAGERGGGQVSVHRLVQYVVRSRMDEQQRREVRHQMHLVLARSRRGEVDDPETWPRFRLLWPHLEVSRAIECRSAEVRRLLVDRVRYLWLVGDLNRGLDRAEQTERIWTDRLQELTDDAKTVPSELATLRRQLLQLRFNKANILRSLGRFEESLEIDQDVLAEQQAMLGPVHPHPLMTAGSLAGDLRGLGRYADALALDTDTHTRWLESYGEEHARTLAALSNLAVSCRQLGDYRTALEHDEAAYQGRGLVHGDTHQYTLASAGNIGRDLREAGEYEQSVTRLRAVAEALRENLGPYSRTTVNAYANLAISLRSAGRADEAAGLLDDAYERLGAEMPSAPDTLACQLSRAVNMLALEEPYARVELAAVHDAYNRLLGPGHPHTIVCVNNLAMALRGADTEPEEALRLAGEAARDFAAVLGPSHPYTLAARTNLAVCLAESAQLDEALDVLDDARQRIEVVLSPEHPDTLRCLVNAAIIRGLAGEASDSEVDGIGRRLAERIGETHPAVLALRRGRLLHRVIDPHPF